MSFGYIGDTSTSVKQQVKNKGILTTQESFDLERQGFLGGSLKLIQTITISSSTAFADFTSIDGAKYDTHFLILENNAGGGDMDILFSNDSGSSFETSNYQTAQQYGTPSGGNGEDRSTSDSKIRVSIGSPTENAYVYLYDLNNSSKYSFATFHSAGNTGFKYGGGVYTQSETINAVRVDGSGGNFNTLVAKLYGVKK